MCNFRVGQKVACIGKRKSFGHPYDLCNWVETGGVYTVKTINHHPGGKVLITVAEIDNSHMVPKYSLIEPGFTAQWFRPVAERKTDISIFTRMLNPSKQLTEA